MFLTAYVQAEQIGTARKAREDEARLARELKQLKLEQRREAARPSEHRGNSVRGVGKLNPAI